jgi:signal transduction histidine kinase
VLTVAMPGESETVRYVQAAFLLTLHDRQVADLLGALIIVVGLGVAGALLVAWAVVERALSPVRAALEHERAFVAAASHELRTPVAVIRGTAEVLRREELVSPGGAPLLADMEAEADRLGSLVGDLAALSAAQAAPVTASTRLDLAALAGDVVRRAAPLAAARGVRLELAGAVPVQVRTDPERLIQVALILIDNALRVTPAGRAIRVSATGRDRAGELSVEDEGPGIPESDRSRIFEPFVRGAGEPRSDGSGLGLSIARSIVERLGGRIRVETASSGGARFTVAVPRA